MVGSSILFTKYGSQWASGLRAISLIVGVTTFGPPYVFAYVYSGIINLARSTLCLMVPYKRAIYYARGWVTSLNTRHRFYVFQWITLTGNWRHAINEISISV